MTGTAHSFEYASNQSAFGKEGIWSGIGDRVAYWYDPTNTNIVKGEIDGKILFGALDGEINLNQTLGVFEVMTGVPAKVIGVVKTEEKLEIPLSFMAVTPKTEERILGSSIPLVVTEPAVPVTTTIDETPAAATNYSVVLTSVIGLKVGDTIGIVTGNATYGTQEEFTTIESLNPTTKTVTLNPPISQLPADLAVVRKIKTITKVAGGNKLPKTFAVQFKIHDNSSEKFELITIERCQIKAVNSMKSGNQGKDVAKGGFTLIAIPKKISYTDPDDGLTKQGWQFYESETYYKQ